MVTGLLDTSIIIDYLRGYTPSYDWYHQQDVLGINPLVWLEVVTGEPNKAAQRPALNFLKQFTLVYLTTTAQEWAMKMGMVYSLSHGVGLEDCLIAAPSHRLQVPLYTRNLKHFRPLIGDLAKTPY